MKPRDTGTMPILGAIIGYFRRKKITRKLDSQIKAAGIKAKNHIKKHTFWRKIQAFMLWNVHFQNDPQTIYMRNLITDTNYFNNI